MYGIDLDLLESKSILYGGEIIWHFVMKFD